MSLSNVIGDLGCPGVDVDAFRASCRVPLYPERWNRWLLWRTARDNPSVLDVERSTFAVMRKWFELVEQPSGFSWPGKGEGKIDNLILRMVPYDWTGGWGPSIARREQCSPVPMMRPGTGMPLGIAVEFVFRGMATNMAWPVHRPAVIGSYCPIGADWMLARAYAAPATEAPQERTTADEMAEAARKVGRAILPSPISVVMFAALGLGVVLAAKRFRR